MIYPKYLGSSINENKLSLTIKGAIPLIIFLLPLFGVIDISESNIIELIDAIVISIAGAVTLYGVARKLIVKLTE